MALILKENETIRPNMSDNYGIDIVLSSAYAIVDRIEIARNVKELSFVIVIYGSLAARNDKEKSPVDQVPVMVRDDAFDTLMASSCLITACYDLVKDSPEFAPFESDEL